MAEYMYSNMCVYGDIKSSTERVSGHFYLNEVLMYSFGYKITLLLHSFCHNWLSQGIAQNMLHSNL